jgi:hypothetical protein
MKSLKGARHEPFLKAFASRAINVLRSVGAGLLSWLAALLLHAVDSGLKMALGTLVGIWIVLVVLLEAINDFWPLTTYAVTLTVRLLSKLLHLILST